MKNKNIYFLIFVLVISIVIFNSLTKKPIVEGHGIGGRGFGGIRNVSVGRGGIHPNYKRYTRNDYINDYIKDNVMVI
jgi:hypothetical protein